MRPSREIQLATPIEHGAESVITSITLRRPKVREFRIASDTAKGGVDTMRHLIAQMAALPPSVIDGLELDDFLALQQAAVDLLPERFRALLQPGEEGGDATSAGESVTGS